MKILRLFLILAGLALVVWGVMDYNSSIPETTQQALPKILLGALGVLGSFLAKNRR